MRFLGTPPPYDLTYSDVFLTPVHSGVSSRLDVSLAPDDGTGATLPIVAANMNSVTGPRLAATLARRGGIAVLPQDLPPGELVAAIAWVKEQSPRWDSPIVFSPKATVWDARRAVTGGRDRGVVLVDKDGALRGVVDAASIAEADAGSRLLDLAEPQWPTIDGAVTDPRAVFDQLESFGVEFAAVVDDGTVVGTASRRSAVRQAIYEPALDASLPPSGSTATSRAGRRSSRTWASTCSCSTPRTGTRRACCARSRRSQRWASVSQSSRATS